MTKYQYSARILPIGQPVVIPDLKGRRTPPLTFTEDHFRIERQSRNPAKLLLEHDWPSIGKVDNLWRHQGWFVADFTLDPELTVELEIGQPVSVGLSVFENGGTYLSEVSVVSRGNVQGAEITSRHELKETPPPPATKPATATPTRPTTARPKPKPAPALARRLSHEAVDHRAHDAELRRRLDWLETNGLDADVETVHANLRRELYGPSLDDLAREYGISGRKVVDGSLVRNAGQVLGVR